MIETMFRREIKQSESLGLAVKDDFTLTNPAGSKDNPAV